MQAGHNDIKARIQASIQLKESLLADEAFLAEVSAVAQMMVQAFKNGKKVLFCGNGGSAADAQHLAAELSGRFYINRKPLFAEALHVNTSYLTATANDFSFDEIYSRAVEAKGQSGDVLVAISTSGSSANILKALEMAKSLGMVTVGFTGEKGTRMLPVCDHVIKVPSTDTPRIQEVHILIGHIVCELVEAELFS